MSIETLSEPSFPQIAAGHRGRAATYLRGLVVALQAQAVTPEARVSINALVALSAAVIAAHQDTRRTVQRITDENMGLRLALDAALRGATTSSTTSTGVHA